MLKISVAGEANVLCWFQVLKLEMVLVKMMIYFMGACAAGVVVGGKGSNRYY